MRPNIPMEKLPSWITYNHIVWMQEKHRCVKGKRRFWEVPIKPGNFKCTGECLFHHNTKHACGHIMLDFTMRHNYSTQFARLDFTTLAKSYIAEANTLLAQPCLHQLFACVKLETQGPLRSRAEATLHLE